MQNWRNRKFLWGLMPVLVALEILFWQWAGGESLVKEARYPVLKDCPSFGMGRIFCNFSHFTLFWKMPPPDRAYPSLFDLWLSDNSLIIVNLLHIFFFWSAGMFIPLIFRVSASEAFAWLMVWNVLHEYIGEGWLWDPSFSDLWCDTLFSSLGCLVASLLPRLPRHSESRKSGNGPWFG